jgi:hydroxymethylpyrimidine pyrophosphatase-like HAD family hydrolase
VVLYSGRRQQSVFEDARLIGQRSYIFELGCGLVVDGEREWLTGECVPSAERGTIYDQLSASGAPELLLARYAGALEYHTPWSEGREVSHLFRGDVDQAEVDALLADAGFGWLRLVDNGVVHEHQMPGLGVTRAYHLIPAVSSKSRAVARHMQARGYRPQDCIAAGDSREDMDAASVVSEFWLVANALERDPGLADVARARPGVRIASEGYGAGVYEAVLTRLAARE